MANQQLKDCDRCGITYYKHELLKQNGLWVCREDYDRSPPSTRNLGGEGEITKGANFRADYESYAAVNEKTVYVMGTGTLTYQEDWMYVKANSNIMSIISANTTQISTPPKHGNTLCVEGTHDTYKVKFYHGSGLILHKSADCILGDGDAINFIYDTSNSLNKWVETSRTKGGI